MKRLTLAAGIGSLLLLQVFSLQAQNPANLPVDAPVFQADSRTYQALIAQPVPAPPTPQPAQGQKAQEAKSNEFAKYPIWLLIEDDGVQFLQTQEEIATNQNAIPPNVFLLGCVTVDFKGYAGEQKPDFQLNCEDFLLMGRYGTKQNLEVQGASLKYSTRSRQIRLQGSDELPLEFYSVDEASETRMQADEITLQLDSRPRTVTRYVPRNVIKSGRPFTEYVPVKETLPRGNSFQLSAQNVTSLETSAMPQPNPGSTYGSDAPTWDPDYRESGGPPEYDDPSGGFYTAPRPAEGNNAVPYYDKPAESGKSRKGEDRGFKPSPAPIKPR